MIMGLSSQLKNACKACNMLRPQDEIFVFQSNWREGAPNNGKEPRDSLGLTVQLDERKIPLSTLSSKQNILKMVLESKALPFADCTH